MEEATRKRKFKYTRELIRIARLDGMTQQEIAALCRTQQSVVSGWEKGKGLAHEHQVVELRKRYGTRLNRTTSRVYFVRKNDDAAEAWETTEEAAQIRGLASLSPDALYDSKPFQALMEKYGLGHHFDSVENLKRESRKAHDLKHRPFVVACVEGPVVIRYSFCRPVIDRRTKHPALQHEPVVRWVVHHCGRGRFVLVKQHRRELMTRDGARWHAAIDEAFGQVQDMGRDFEVKRLTRADDELAANWVDCADDAGRWESLIEGPMAPEALLEMCDAWLADPERFHGPHDEAVLPLLLRKMLVEQGYDLPDVVRIGVEA